jgi:periplasmic protein TonB
LPRNPLLLMRATTLAAVPRLVSAPTTSVFDVIPEVYSPREIALAAGVPEFQVIAALERAGAGRHPYVLHADAVRIGRALARGVRTPFASTFAPTESRPLVALRLAFSGTVHGGIVAAMLFITMFNLAPRAAVLPPDDRPSEPMRLVFLTTPGPGGGGGGGGLQQRPKPPKALREGKHTLSSPLPIRREPKPIVPTPAPPEPKPEPPLKAEQLPAVVAPIVPAPADPRNRVGVLDQTPSEADSHGPGKGGGTGTGTGTGIGQGDGSGVGPGSGGGTGGGPYRPGSGIEAPRLLHEVRADYTEEARQRNIAGDVVLEIVVRRDGSVGDVKILKGLPSGLNDKAVQAVRQWRFAPARRLGTPVDVIVEVSVEFKLR